MRIAPHPNRPVRSGQRSADRYSYGKCAVTICLLMTGLTLSAEDSVGDLLQAAKSATAPAPLTSPASAEKLKIPSYARSGTILLSNGVRLKGNIWNNLDTPYRVWDETAKIYRDVDLAQVKSIEVHVLSQTMEDDWRWLKEGSDEKVYSGKKYPNLQLAYKFTLPNDQIIEGGVVGLVYATDAGAIRTFTLYKQYKGNLDETFKDLLYISSIAFDSAPAASAGEKKTTHLPLLD